MLRNLGDWLILPLSFEMLLHADVALRVTQERTPTGDNISDAHHLFCYLICDLEIVIDSMFVEREN